MKNNNPDSSDHTSNKANNSSSNNLLVSTASFNNIPSPQPILNKDVANSDDSSSQNPVNSFTIQVNDIIKNKNEPIHPLPTHVPTNTTTTTTTITPHSLLLHSHPLIPDTHTTNHHDINNSNSNNNNNNSKSAQSHTPVSSEIARQILIRKPYVELHVHLDGAMRPSSLWEIAIAKNYEFPSSIQNYSDFLQHVTVPSSCTSLREFLETFQIFMPIIAGDGAALERIAFEFVEDQNRNNVIYTEARYCPHLLLGNGSSSLSPDAVIQHINKGFSSATTKYGITVKTILCCFTEHPEWSNEIVDLAYKYKLLDGSVVGIDIAGNEYDLNKPEFVQAFQKAQRLGIHRTVHAGEAGSAKNVYDAIMVLGATRIGHGYATIENETVWNLVRERDIHLECCLTSSIQTGSVKRFMRRLSVSDTFMSSHEHLPALERENEFNNLNDEMNEFKSSNNIGGGSSNSNSNSGQNNRMEMDGKEQQPVSKDDNSIKSHTHNTDKSKEIIGTPNTVSIGKLARANNNNANNNPNSHVHHTHHHKAHNRVPWHPVQYFSGADFNFSLNTDDPLVSRINLAYEYNRAVNEFHLRHSDIGMCSLNAARSCFLPENEKQILLNKLIGMYLPNKIVQSWAKSPTLSNDSMSNSNSSDYNGNNEWNVNKNSNENSGSNNNSNSNNNNNNSSTNNNNGISVLGMNRGNSGGYTLYGNSSGNEDTGLDIQSNPNVIHNQ